jgi:rubrerythrin
MEAQSYNVPREVRSGLRSLTEAEEASIKFSWREEYFAKMAAMEVAGESMAIEDYLALDTYAGDANFEILQQHAKEYRMNAMAQNMRQQKHLKKINTARMTVKTMEKYAPLPITNIRMYDSPGVPGMLQRMSAGKRGSTKMYNH